jgi:arylsulfatase A-like enzyme/Flp pilus assembly protein TadD
LTACSGENPSTEIPIRPNVFLITVDTLRADHLSSYGYREIQTPQIDSLGEDGLLFSQAITPVPITLPAHASIMTGLYPFSHGIRDNSGGVLDSEAVTLAEALNRHQYETGAFVGAFVLDSRFGLDQGFETYFDNFESDTFDLVNLQISERRADSVLSEVQDWIRRNKQSPMFCWIHLFDPHTPYDPPESFRSADLHPYDSEILFTDYELGKFFQFLKSQDLYQKSLIILTSDHGEGLGQHREDTHGMFIYDSTIHVPLLFKLPGNLFPGKTINQQVRLIDLMPTVLSLTGIESPAEVQGTDLSPLWKNDASLQLPAYSETLLPNLNYGWRGLRGLRSGGFKFIDSKDPKLFQLQRDVSETDNLAASDPDRLQLMKRELINLIEENSDVDLLSPVVNADQETLERLRSLGYLSGSGGPTGDPFRGSLEDPEEKVHLFNQVWQAQEMTSEGRFQDSIRLIDQILREDKTIFLAHSIQSLNYLQSNQPERAITFLQQAIRLRPDDSGSHFYLGIASLQKGDLGTAASALETSLRFDPRNLAALNNLGTVYTRLNSYEKASQIFGRLLSENRKDVAAWVNFGVVRMMLEDWDASLEAFNEALKINPAIPEVYNNIGLIYLNKKRFDLAISNFRRSLELNPDYPLAQQNLDKALKARSESGD